MAIVTQAEYARHRNVSRQMIGKLIGSGKIPESALKRENGKVTGIELERADLALGQTIERVVAHEEEMAGETGADSAAAASGRAGYDGGAGVGLTKARTASAFYQANLARLQYEEKIGHLVSRADVEISMVRAAEALKRDLEQLPARADDLATAFTRGGIDGVRSFLKTLQREILGTLASNMRLLEQGDLERAEADEEQAA